jgi:hypothetical protein
MTDSFIHDLAVELGDLIDTPDFVSNPNANADTIAMCEDVLRRRLLELLMLEPCHVTGMHDLNHTVNGVCDIQRGAVFKRLLATLDVSEEEVPHRLHDESCYWCHSVPSQEVYREKLRRLHAWAGVPISADLAEPAWDAPRPEDVEAAYAVVPVEWTNYGTVRKMWSESLPAIRFSYAIDTLTTAERVQNNGGNVTRIRRTP